MRSHETHRSETVAAVEAAELPIADRLAALDSVYIRVVERTGQPVPCAKQFTMANVEENLDAINEAHWRDCLRAIATETGGDGTKTPGKYCKLSNEDKRRYGELRANGGGILLGADGEPVRHKGNPIAVEAFVWQPAGRMSLLEEAIDRVRFDWLRWAGYFPGDGYDQHKTRADLFGPGSRESARKQIRERLGERPGDFRGAKGKNGESLAAKVNGGDTLFSNQTYAELIEAKAAEVRGLEHKPMTKNMGAVEHEDAGV